MKKSLSTSLTGEAVSNPSWEGLPVTKKTCSVTARCGKSFPLPWSSCCFSNFFQRMQLGLGHIWWYWKLAFQLGKQNLTKIKIWWSYIALKGTGVPAEKTNVFNPTRKSCTKLSKKKENKALRDSIVLLMGSWNKTGVRNCKFSLWQTSSPQLMLFCLRVFPNSMWSATYHMGCNL